MKCVICGTEFEPKHHNKTCSKTCSKIRAKEVKRIWQENNREKMTQFQRSYYESKKKKSIWQRLTN